MCKYKLVRLVRFPIESGIEVKPKWDKSNLVRLVRLPIVFGSSVILFVSW